VSRRTWLVTDRMHPALAARVARQVRAKGRVLQRSELRQRRSATFGKLVPLFAMLAVGALFVAARIHDGSRFAARKAESRQALAGAREAVSSIDPARVEAARNAITRLARRGSAPDVVDESLRAPGALDDFLSRPGLYVRGMRPAMEEASALADEAAYSMKDGLLLCLFEPPRSVAESDLLPHIRSRYLEGALVDEATGPIRRLVDLERAHGLRSPLLDQGIDRARTRAELDRLDLSVRKVDVEAGLRAARAEVVVVALDEPPGLRPTDDDGSPHEVRVSLIDLEADRELVTLTRRVGELPMRSSTRARYGVLLDACALAVEVRLALE
jgi:hypothetical protein